MSGPLPKSAARQRRNRKSQALSAPENVEAPPLPELAEPWNPLTLAWWERIWRSPVSTGWIESDVDGLYILAGLVDRYWTERSTSLATEIRLQRACFGLDWYARRRLDVKIAPPAGDAPKPKRRAKSEGEADPRDHLRA